jgi:organic hydroperoxide reductase OsmC/OhrA
MEAHYYEVNISWNQDRKGFMCSPDINPEMGENGCIEVATPPQFDKGIPGIWSPEHLFTAAVSSCLMTTFLAVAEASKLEFTGFQCASKGKLEQLDGKFLMTEVILEPTVTIVREQDRRTCSARFAKIGGSLSYIQLHKVKCHNDSKRFL